ncbi:hypothetical protein GOBAR_DD36171 [Gossypium barbadense]|nr:hypothetical protein GOBAR_DD36171 [Gossypium barbadense]
MMFSFNRIAKSITKPVMYTIHSKFGKPHLNLTTLFKTLSTKPPQNGKDDSWNDAWETAWLPDDISPKNRAPWEADVNFPSNEESAKMALSSDVDAETKAFVEDMNENWNERRKIFDSTNADLENSRVPSSSELKTKPDGWETTSKAPDGNVWEMSQREEDILLQEFDRRIAYSSFIKTHIFSRRRPIDGWKYMIEEIGPNARKGKGSVSRYRKEQAVMGKREALVTKGGPNGKRVDGILYKHWKGEEVRIM